MTKTYTIEEWGNKRILSKTLFQFMFIQNGNEAVYSTTTGKYIIYTTLKNKFHINLNMTAFELYNNSEKLNIEQNY